MKNLSLIAAFFLSFAASAQWTDNTAVNTQVTSEDVTDLNSITTTTGQTYVVFWKNVGEPQNLQLRLQVIDANGFNLLGADGVAVDDSIHMSTYTVNSSLTLDSDNNLYICETGTIDAIGHIYKMNTNGEHLWDAEAVNFPDGYFPTVLPLSTGGLLAGWSTGTQAMMQQYDANGNAQWENPVALESGTSKTAPAAFFELSSGDFIAVFHTYNFGVSSLLYAQRYNANGESQWDVPTQMADRATAFNMKYSHVQEGDIIYYGYMASSGMRFDSYLQRLDPDGTLPWGINGSDFDVNETNYEMDTKIAMHSGSQYIWSICRYADPSQGQHGEYVQKFDKETGARLLTDNAKEVFPISEDYTEHSGTLYTVNDQPFFLAKIGMDNGVSPVRLGAVLLDENGDFVWDSESKPVATFDANKSRIYFSNAINGQAVAIFNEDKGNGGHVYAQNFIDSDITGLNDYQIPVAELRVYPTPAKTIVNISFNSPVNSVAKLSVFNTVGKVVYSASESIGFGENLIRINVGKLPEGMYFYRITGSNKLNWSGKIMTTK